MHKLTLFLVFLGGCTISEKAFPSKYAGVFCDKAFECDESAAEDQYGTEKECKEELTPLVEELFGEIPEGCEYNAKNATQCIGAMKSTDCDAEEIDPDDEEACENIYECDETAE